MTDGEERLTHGGLASDLDRIWRAGLKAADADRAVSRQLAWMPGRLLVAGREVRLSARGRIFLVAIGKAAPSMARAAAQILGDLLHGGVVTSHADFKGGPGELGLPASLRVIPAGHPIPDRGSLAAGRAAASLASRLGPEDVLLALVSGGGSAMFELPRPSIGLRDWKNLNRLLLRSGAPIEALNTVRQALSLVKGGGLVRMAAPARVIGVILSDIVGDPLALVASGPTVPCRTRLDRAREVLHEHGLWERTPGAIRRELARHRTGAKTSSAGPRPINLRIGGNREVVDAAAVEARALGYRVVVMSRRLHGEAREAGRRLARRLLALPPGTCLLAGGETTVAVRGRGRGGRNQELAVAAALVLEGSPGAGLISLATDGVDGPTEAAGAGVDGSSMARARANGFDPEQRLAANDSFPLLDSIGALIRTGPTGTNVGDLVVGLMGKQGSEGSQDPAA